MKELNETEKAKIDRKLTLDRLEREIQNSEREISDNNFNKEQNEEKLKLIDRKIKAITEQGKLIADNMGKPEDKKENDWEFKPEFWVTQKELQEIGIAEKVLELEGVKRMLNKHQNNIKDQLESLSKSLLKVKQELEETKRKQI